MRRKWHQLRIAARASGGRVLRSGALLIGLAAACGTLESRDLEPPPTAGAAGEADGGTGGTHASGSGGKGANKAGANTGATSAGGDEQQPGTGGGANDAVCGNGQREGDEACDDDNVESGDGCSAGCRVEHSDPACGDGQKGGEEACDDGDLQPGDGCDDRCRLEECGNARIDAGEECEPPNVGKCNARCVRLTERCGDGDVQQVDGEQCDDGNDDAGDGCFDCRLECGDGRIDRKLGEDCEPRYSEHCSAQCKWLPACGDGEIQAEAGEQCDPSNGESCVACRFATPSCEDGMAGCGGQGPSDCVPSSSSDLLQNGAFTLDTSGWSTPSSLVELSSVDDGSPAPRALAVTFAKGSVRAVSGAYQCVPVLGNSSYELVAKYRIANDAPYGVGASVTTALYAGTRCDGTPVGSPKSGPVGEVRDAWTPYAHSIDTSALPTGAEARLFLRLNVVRPADVEGSQVTWDSASVPAPELRCGNCELDDGESCDDGNRVDGDGCNGDCALELCGDGEQTGGEACDDGNAVFATGDECTAACQLPNACDRCSLSHCEDDVDACLALAGSAESGRGAGIPRSTLCDALRACVRRTACELAVRKTAGVEGAFPENCYCGTAGEHCFDTPGAANGSCRREIEAALEATEPATVLGRFGGADPDYPIFGALKHLLVCENDACSAECLEVPACGNGNVEDRNLAFTFVVNGTELECQDALTSTGRGCSVEECDDGNVEPGDGCDEHCFVEDCGNYVVQSGEQCDDGNDDDGDGCSRTCQAEFNCGDGVLEQPFEQCDPPTGGHVCTEDEYADDPAQCGCDTACRRIVCGNGTVQRPEEACDPPNGFSCGEDCQNLDESPCEACMSANPGIAPYNDEFCSPDPLCVAVKQCVVAAGCFVPLPASCYCGSTLDGCDLPEFVPTGPCAEEIYAGAGDDSPTNDQVLGRLFAFLESPTGTANSVLDLAKTQGCADACFPP